MLHLMRKHAGSLMIKIILGAIVVVFVFWGIGSFRERRAGRVALVNGEPITVAEYRESYNNLIQRLRSTFGESLDEAMIAQLKVKEQAINQLIDQRLLVQEAQRLHLDISNSELADAIRSVEAFQAGGIFDARLYQRVLNLNRMTPEAFEALQRQSMLVQRLDRFVADGVKVSDLEIDAWIAWQNTEVNIQCAFFDPASYKDIEVKSEDLESYFKENASAYQTDEQINVRYVQFDPGEYQAQVKLTEEDLKEHYEANIESYTTPKTVEARHILLKVAPSAKQGSDDEKKKALIGILNRIQKGEDFAALAKAYSEDTTKESGGLIGPFQKEEMVKPFAEAAFSLKPGEISEPVRTQFGWHLIKVEKINEEKTPSFLEAREKIQEKLTQERAKILAYDHAEAMYDAALGGMDFEKAAREQNRETVATGFITRKTSAGLPADPATFANIAFELQAKEISDIHEMKGAYFILQALEKKPPQTPELKAVLDRVKADYLQKKKLDKSKSDAEAFLAIVKSGKGINEAAREKNVKVVQSGFFKRNAPIPVLGYAPEISKTAFALTEKAPVAQEPIRGEKGYFVIDLVERRVIETADAAADRGRVKVLLKRQKQVLAFSTLVSLLRKKAQIHLEEGFTDA